MGLFYIAADCGAPDTADPNVRVAPSDTLFDTVARYYCIEGYVLQGTANRTCQMNSTWSGTAPTCESE